MSLELYFAFVAATAVLIIMPGPVVSLVIANALSHGTRAGLVTVGGAQAAIAIQLVVVALGLTSLIAVMAEWFEWLRWIGAAYLVWLGVQKWRAKPLLPDEHREQQRPDRDAGVDDRAVGGCRAGEPPLCYGRPDRADCRHDAPKTILRTGCGFAAATNR